MAHLTVRTAGAMLRPGWPRLAPVVAACALFGVPGQPWQWRLCVPLIAIFGLPHGAADWGLSRAILQPRLGNTWWLGFGLFYGALMAAAALAAAAAPVLAIAAFIAVAIWHFGAEDARSLTLRAGPAEFLACGAVPILLPAILWPSQYADILQSLGVMQAAAGRHLISLLALPACLSWCAAAACTMHRNPARRVTLAADFAALIALQAAAPPLIAFTAYFCLVHGPRHMESVPQAQRGWPVLAVSAAAIVLVAAVIVPLAQARHAGAEWAAANGLFWGLAALTWPHVLLGRLAEARFDMTAVRNEDAGAAPPCFSLAPARRLAREG